MSAIPEEHAVLASATRRQVLELLVRSPGPLDAAQVAGPLGLHVTTARFHLDQLTDAGLARRAQGNERRRGRPRMLYSPSGTARDRNTREQLIDVLAGAVDSAANGAPEDTAVVAGREWGEAFAREENETADAHLMRVTDRLGFEPVRDGHQVWMHGCPFREAAAKRPEVICAVHRGLVEQLMAAEPQPGAEAGLDAGARGTPRLLPFVEPERCLVLLP